MLKLDIPGYKKINIKYIIFDYNGTIAVDGLVKDEIKDKIIKLKDIFDIYVLTADTYGNAKKELESLDVNFHIISKENGTEDKMNFIKKLGKNNCIAFGNGSNDCLMVKEAEIGICIMEQEGCSVITLMNSDLVVKDIEDGIDMLLKPKRLIANLRR